MFYTLDLKINLLELDPTYPKEPKTLGEHIRKARMDKGLMIRELAALVGVDPSTIINWELRNVKPAGKRLKQTTDILELGIMPDSLTAAPQKNKLRRINLGVTQS